MLCHDCVKWCHAVLYMLCCMSYVATWCGVPLDSVLYCMTLIMDDDQRQQSPHRLTTSPSRPYNKQQQPQQRHHLQTQAYAG